jgi:hypothetical protein
MSVVDGTGVAEIEMAQRTPDERWHIEERDARGNVARDLRVYQYNLGFLQKADEIAGLQTKYIMAFGGFAGDTSRAGAAARYFVDRNDSKTLEFK